MRVLIVDDEPHAARRLTQLLGELRDVEVVGTCTVAADAASVAAEVRPDVCLLDVEMPELSGLDVAPRLDCAVVFVTAHQRYAVEAFDSEPVDFVVKPVERHRLRRALDRVRKRLESRPETTPLRRLLVRADERLIPVELRNVDYFESVGNYVKVHAGTAAYLFRSTLAALEKRLVGDSFVRTHRAYIVNSARVRELRAISHGDFELLLVCGATVPFSRAYREHLARLGLAEAR